MLPSEIHETAERRIADSKMRYMIRFTQGHESFHRAEIEALGLLEEVDLEILSYDPNVSLLQC